MAVVDPVEQLFAQLRHARPMLEELLAATDRLSGREERLGETTESIVRALRELAPGRHLNHGFVATIDRWADGSEPARSSGRMLVNAFLQARFFLQLAVHCASQEASTLAWQRERPSEVAAFLRLYEL